MSEPSSTRSPTALTADADLSMRQKLCAALVDRSDAPKLIGQDGAVWSARALLQEIERVAGFLASQGIRRGDRVAYALPDGPQTAIIAMGLMSIATAAPMNSRLTESERERQLRSLRIQAIITPPDVESPLLASAERLGLRILTLPTPGTNPAVTPPDQIEWATPDDTILIVQTSGTTGDAKIVPLRHRNVLSMMRVNCDVLALTPADRCLGVMPLYHIHGLGAVLCSLLAGGSIVVTDGFSADSFYAALQRFEPTWYTAVPTVHQVVLSHATHHPEIVQHVAAKRQLRFVRSGSAPMPAGVPERLIELFQTSYVEASGATECSAYICSNRFGDERIGSVGRSMPNTQIRIVDERGNDVAPGEEGELLARGPGVFDGYERPDGSSVDGLIDGYFHTGDLAQIDSDGFVYLTGRLKEQINRAGMKVSPREVDAVIASHPSVAHAATFALPDPRVGDEIAVAVVRKPGDAHDVSSLDLQRYAAERLADHKVPRRIVFVDAIPTNAVGKISRVALPKQLKLSDEAPALTATTITVDRGPQSPTELRVAALWGQVLSHVVDDCDETFASAEGDSLQAVALAIELERAFGRKFPVAAIPADATVRSIAHAIDDDGWRPTPAAPVVLRAGPQTVGSNTSNANVICLPGVGGNVHCFASVAAALSGTAATVIGLPLPGTDGLESPLRDIGTIADRAIASIDRHAANGELILTGYSFGGRVAFEAVSRLVAARRRVKAVVLIDTPAPGWPPPLRGWGRLRMQLSRFRREGCLATFKRLANLDGAKAWESPEAMLRELALQDAPPERQELQLAMIAAARVANDAWRPQPLDVPVLVIRAATPAWEHCDTSDPTMGWQPFVMRPIRVETIGGTHATLFHAPHAASIGAVIRDVIASR